MFFYLGIFCRMIPAGCVSILAVDAECFAPNSSLSARGGRATKNKGGEEGIPYIFCHIWTSSALTYELWCSSRKYWRVLYWHYSACWRYHDGAAFHVMPEFSICHWICYTHYSDCIVQNALHTWLQQSSESWHLYIVSLLGSHPLVNTIGEFVKLQAHSIDLVF